MAKDNKPAENIAYRVLIEPWITEAATMAAQENKYVFKVAKDANKNEIKKSIEILYNVNVINVRTINIPAKKRTRGRIVGKKAGFKKAIVKIKSGESIDVFGNK
jgi:large subunit ribosomal protein L23